MIRLVFICLISLSSCSKENTNSDGYEKFTAFCRFEHGTEERCHCQTEIFKKYLTDEDMNNFQQSLEYEDKKQTWEILSKHPNILPAVRKAGDEADKVCH